MLAPSLLSLLALSSPADEPPTETPLTLEAAIEIALAHANEMIQAREDVLLVDSDYAAALSAILPRFDLNVSAGGAFSESQILEFRNRGSVENTPDDNPVFLFGDWDDGFSNSFVDSVWSLGLRGRQLIFDGGRWWTAISKAEVDKVGRQAALRAARNVVRAQVAQAFFGLERARRAIDVLAAQIELDHQQVERARSLLRVGRGSPADVATAGRNLAADEIQRVQAEIAEGQARRAFNLQLGLRPQRGVQLVMPGTISTVESLEADVPPLEVLLSAARQHRPELASQRAAVTSAERDVAIARADYWPSVALEAGYNRRSRRPDRIFANPFENYTATLDLVVQWNLYEGGATSARVDRAQTQVRKEIAQLETLEREALAEVEDARQRWYDQERIFGFAQQQIVAAKDALRLASGLYEAGRGTSLELRTAQLELTRAQITAINARLDAEAARADLARAVGTEDWGAPER